MTGILNISYEVIEYVTGILNISYEAGIPVTSRGIGIHSFHMWSVSQPPHIGSVSYC